jgi:hypothetical protein
VQPAGRCTTGFLVLHDMTSEDGYGAAHGPQGLVKVGGAEVMRYRVLRLLGLLGTLVATALTGGASLKGF